MTSTGRQYKGLRGGIGGKLLEAFFNTASGLGRLHPMARPARHGVEVLRNIPYLDDGDAAHLLDVWRPIHRKGPCPTLIYVHGGAFTILSKETHWLMALAFARRGFAVFNINYRLAPEHPFPAAIEDACRAAVWVTEHAAEYGGDRARMVFAGESAGGNLATSMALACCYRRPEPWARELFDANPGLRATLPACAVLEASNMGRFAASGKLSPFLLRRLATIEEYYLPDTLPSDLDRTLANPLVLLETGKPPDRPLPPMCAIVGTRDPLLNDTRRLKSALDALGVPAEAHYHVGGVHAFHAFAFKAQAQEAWREQFAFLARHVEGIEDEPVPM